MKIRMKITKAQLLRAEPNLYKPRLEEFVESFNTYADTFGINTPLRAIHYLAQVFHESAALRYTEEIASGKAYEGRKDLGNIYKGDGVRFKGRGYIQVTGRKNYQEYADSDFCVGDLMKHPEWLSKSPGNQKASMFFWWKNKLNAVADKDDVKAVTKKVNGGYNGLANRMFYYRRFKKELTL